MIRPHVLLGECTGQMLKVLKDLGWGRMFVRMTPAPYDGEKWGFDNGAFALHMPGGKRVKVTERELSTWEDQFIKRLMAAVKECVGRPPILAVLPDLPFQGRASLEYSLEWKSSLPNTWPWYLAVQDGMDLDEVGEVLKKYYLPGVFLGGSNHFKVQASVWARKAREWGVKFHFGRCGTTRKLRQAFAVQADSVDSAFPMWTKIGLQAYIRTWQMLETAQPFGQ